MGSSARRCSQMASLVARISASARTLAARSARYSRKNCRVDRLRNGGNAASPRSRRRLASSAPMPILTISRSSMRDFSSALRGLVTMRPSILKTRSAALEETTLVTSSMAMKKISATIDPPAKETSSQKTVAWRGSRHVWKDVPFRPFRAAALGSAWREAPPLPRTRCRAGRGCPCRRVRAWPP